MKVSRAQFPVSMALLVTVSLLGHGGRVLVAQEPSLFTDVSPGFQQDAQFQGETGELRARYVAADLRLLAPGPVSSRYDVGDTVRLNLFDDVSLLAVLNRIDLNPGGGYTWIGQVDGSDSSLVMMAVRDGVLTGNITTSDGNYQLRYVGQDTHVIRQVDYGAYPPEADSIPVDLPESPFADFSPMADDGGTIDVLVVYTPNARSAAGGTTAMHNLIDLAISETNTSYSNSGINQRLRLVHRTEVSYLEGADMSTDLGLLQGTSDGYMDNVHQLRDTHGADEVVLIVERNDYCGIAYFMSSVSSSFAPYAFAVVAQDCATGYYSFGHELGHNMAARHDRYADPNNGPYSFNHGYVNPPDRWRTIMAYNSECAAMGFNCTRLIYWSNPDVTYGGDAMGIPEGSPLAADNRKTLNYTAFTVANFRQSVAGDESGCYVLDGFGGVHPAGGASAITPATPYFGFDVARDLELAATGYYVLDGFGGVHAGGSAPTMTPETPYFGIDVARDLELAATGFYVLDGFGGVHAGGGAPTTGPATPYFGFDVARDLELDTTGFQVLDGFGGVHAGGGASPMMPTTSYFGFDIARDLELAATGFYVLDGFGGVHTGGGGSAMNPPAPYFGFDIARDLELLSSGYYVLDGYGVIHAGGGASLPSPNAPYFGMDIAKDLEVPD